MTPFKFVAEFPCDPDKFWKLFWHDPYNVELYGRIGVKERRFLEKVETDDAIRFKLRIMPQRDLPGFIKKLVGGDLGYTEMSTWHKKDNRIVCHIEPTLFKEKTKIDAIYTITPIGPGRVRRVFDGSISISIPLAGKKIEEFIVSDMEKAYQTAAQVTVEWLERGFA
jgi:hypothetical protein